jgi:peptide/nickel transport system ATP-binding protein
MTSLNPVFTCGNQVAESIQLHKKISTSEAKKQAIEWFRKVKLPEPEKVFSKYPHQLSWWTKATGDDSNGNML